MRILGVDDAGRGCVIGPLVIAGVLIDDETQVKLLELGVKDSKLLSSCRRIKLAEEIRGVAVGTYVVKLSPADIDKVVSSGRRLHKLNRLEAQAMARVVEALRPDVAIVDASDVLPRRYKNHITELLSFPVHVVSEHKADRNYPVVSAASIIAKVERDQEIDTLKARHGDFGSGYTSDPKTLVFLENLLKKHHEYPDFVRRSWKSAKAIRADAKTKQTMLHEGVARA